MNARHRSVSHRLAMVAAVLVMAAGSTVSYAGGAGKDGGSRDGGGGGAKSSARESRGGGSGGGAGGRVERQARSQQSAPQMKSQPSQPKNVARAEQKAINQAQQQSRQQMKIDQRAIRDVQLQSNQSAKQMQPMPQARVQKPAPVRSLPTDVQKPSDVRRAENQAADAARKVERQENKTQRQSEQLAQQQARQQKRSDNRAAQDLLDQQRKDARQSERSIQEATRQARRQMTPEQRKQNKIDDVLSRQAVRNNNGLNDGKADVMPGKANDRFRLDNGVAVTTRGDRKRVRNVVDFGDNNSHNRVKIVNKYYIDDDDCHGSWSWGGHRHYRHWDHDDSWRVSVSIGWGSSWCGPSWGFHYSSYDCWSPGWSYCWTSRPRYYYCPPTYVYCPPRYVTVYPPSNVVYVYPTYAYDPATYTTTGSDYGYYNVQSYSDLDAYDGLTEVLDQDSGDPIGDIPGYQSTYTPDYSNVYGIPVYEQPEPRDDAPVTDSSPMSLAWNDLANGKSDDALSTFSMIVQDDSSNTSAKVGYAIASATLGQDDTAAWAMRRAISTDPDAFGFVPELVDLRPTIDRIVARLRSEAASPTSSRVVNSADRWFLIASLEYLRQDNTSAREALDRSVGLDATRGSTENLRKLLD